MVQQQVFVKNVLFAEQLQNLLTHMDPRHTHGVEQPVLQKELVQLAVILKAKQKQALIQ